jgi:hypothetical protein
LTSIDQYLTSIGQYLTSTPLLDQATSGLIEHAFKLAAACARLWSAGQSLLSHCPDPWPAAFDQYLTASDCHACPGTAGRQAQQAAELAVKLLLSGDSRTASSAAPVNSLRPAKHGSWPSWAVRRDANSPAWITQGHSSPHPFLAAK